MQPFPPPGFIPTKSTIAGIDVYKPAPQREKHQEAVLFQCPQCGGQTAFSAADGGLVCEGCGYQEAPEHAALGRQAESFEFKVTTMQQASHGWGIERKAMQCQNCGSQISIEAGVLTTACPFCSSNNVIQYKAPQDVQRPRFLIPFKIDDSQCHQIARDWLGSSWMVPKALQRVAAVETFTPLYLPFWTFGATAAASWKAQVGHTKTRRDSKGRTHTTTEWRWESGHVEREFADMLVRGTNHVSLHLLEQINQYKLDDLAAYEAKYLAGSHAQAYEIPLEEAWEQARHTMRETTKAACRAQASTNKIRNFSMQLDFGAENWRYILLPVYINTYYYNNEPFQLLLNGQTGAIAGQRPADWRKVGLVAASLFIPAIVLFFFLLIFMINSLEGGGGFMVALLFVAAVFVAVYFAYQAQNLDKV